MDSATLKRMGYAIPPYRLACMAKSVDKIIRELTAPSPVFYSMEEVRFILKQVDELIERGDAEGEAQAISGGVHPGD